MNNSFLMKKLYALKQRQKSIDDFGLVKRKRNISSSAVLDLSFKGRDSARIEEAIVVDDRSDETGVDNVRMEGNIARWLDVMVCLFGRFVE